MTATAKRVASRRDTTTSSRRPVRDDRLLLLGRRIRARRDELGMRQEELSVATGIPASTLYSIEAGRSDPGYLGLLVLAPALKTTVASLLGAPA